MSSTTDSVAKGVFVFKTSQQNQSLRQSQKVRRRKGIGKNSSNKKTELSLLDDEITEQISYRTYKKIWNNLNSIINRIQNENYEKIIKNLTEFIETSYINNIDCILPTAVVLTGINQPDHYEQFQTLAEHITDKTESVVATLESHCCNTVKNAIETMIFEFMENVEDSINESPIKKSQCTLNFLQSWYKNNNKPKLIVILQDFELFKPEVLEDFILILSSYSKNITFVLVLGVATSISAVHNTLSYHVTSRIRMRMFQTTSAPIQLNKILRETLLSPKQNFHLSGKVLKFLTDVFLFYDFSISGFIQSLKYCLIEHCLQGNIYSLCGISEPSINVISSFNHGDYEMIRRLPSFRFYVENLKNPRYIYSILTDDKCLELKLPGLLKKCYIFFKLYKVFVNFFTIMVSDLPKTPMGKNPREIYATCTTKEIIETSEFKECLEILKIYSREELIAKIEKSCIQTEEYLSENFDENSGHYTECKNIILNILDQLKNLLQKVTLACDSIITENKACNGENELKNLSRQELKEKLLQMSKNDKPQSQFRASVENLLNFIKNDIIYKYLCPLTPARGPPLYELLTFSDLIGIRKNIIGAPRSALHMALSDPQFYFQCDCCKLDISQSLLPTLPDISIAYKLHLESGKLINLFDWLQSFRSVIEIKNDDIEEDDEIDPGIQARFTRAVLELQFLGFIKTSKRKADHVARLTW